MKIFTAIAKFLPFLAVVLLILQVVVSNRLATQGADLGKLNQRYGEEKELNEMLVAQVASASALTAMREKALRAGFHEPSKEQIINLTSNVPVALGNTK